MNLFSSFTVWIPLPYTLLWHALPMTSHLSQEPSLIMPFLFLYVSFRTLALFCSAFLKQLFSSSFCYCCLLQSRSSLFCAPLISFTPNRSFFVIDFCQISPSAQNLLQRKLQKWVLLYHLEFKALHSLLQMTTSSTSFHNYCYYIVHSLNSVFTFIRKLTFLHNMKPFYSLI